jgi:HK97 family phage major capsid protein
MDGDHEAADRIRRFNAQVADGNLATVQAITTAAVETTTTAPDVVPTLHRPDLMRAMIDRARPVISRVTNIPISNATPFNIPDVGDFTGVADHTEGTAHAPEGDLLLSGTPVQPRAVSGAYRISRELIDASNPALDRIALRKMVKDYRGLTEAKMVNAMIAADVAADVLSVNTIMGLRAELLAFINDDDEGADFVACSPDFLTALAQDVDGTGRPHLPAVGPMNAVGTWKPGGTGASVENAELVRAAKVTASKAVIARSEGVLWFESAVQQFSFSEVEGPGVVKLALWGYTAAAVPDAADVRVLDTDATA